MKTIGGVVLIGLLLVATVAPAAAQDPGVYVDPLGALLLFPFAVAATVLGGTAAILSAPFTYPYAPYPAAYGYPYPYSYSYGYSYTYPYSYAYPYSYSYPYAYSYPYGYRYSYPYADAASASVSATALPSSYWYYCASARTYYPYVSTCPEAWVPVVPTTR